MTIRVFALFLYFYSFCYGAEVKHSTWKKHLTFEEYLKKYDISNNILDTLDEDDVLLVSDIKRNQKFYELIASNGILLQSLIPVGEELQLHLRKTYSGYELKVIPISYQKGTYIALLSIKSNPYKDITNSVKNRSLAKEFVNLVKESANFKEIKLGDKIAIVYTQKMHLGQPIGTPNIKVAMLETKDKRYFIFKHSDGKYYNEDGEELVKKYMGKPLKHIRITSSFTKRRFHPILKRWKAHHGTDFGAKRGTPILAVADGEIIFSGRMGGYGNVIKIQHKDNYVTLYAHQSKLKAKKDEFVKKGDIIGYIGNTGRSTGPHLHFGLYKNGIPIDPMRLVKLSPDGLKGREKRAFLNRKRRYEKIINKILDENLTSYIWNTIDKMSVKPKMEKYYKQRGW